MSNKIDSLDSSLKATIRGQDHVIPTICSAIKRVERNLGDDDIPQGTFLFLGPTGVGKTETVKAFTTHLLGQDKLFRFDMSEYMYLESVKLLIGDESGYMGRLGEILENHSSGTLLFDEMEKVHEKILDIFLQILNPGRITVGRGKVFDLRKFYIVMTSNIGGQEVMRMNNLPFATIERTVKDILLDHLRPELINRFQEILVFNKLSFDAQRQIALITLDKEIKRLGKKGYQIVPSPQSVEFLIRNGIDKIYGARPMKRCVEKHVQNAISIALDHHQSGSGNLVIDPSGKFLILRDVQV